MTKIQGCKLGLKREAVGTERATRRSEVVPKNTPTRSHGDARQTGGGGDGGGGGQSRLRSDQTSREARQWRDAQFNNSYSFGF